MWLKGNRLSSSWQSSTNGDDVGPSFYVSDYAAYAPTGSKPQSIEDVWISGVSTDSHGKASMSIGGGAFLPAVSATITIASGVATVTVPSGTQIWPGHLVEVLGATSLTGVNDRWWVSARPTATTFTLKVGPDVADGTPTGTITVRRHTGFHKNINIDDCDFSDRNVGSAIDIRADATMFDPHIVSLNIRRCKPPRNGPLFFLVGKNNSLAIVETLNIERNGRDIMESGGLGGIVYLSSSPSADIARINHLTIKDWNLESSKTQYVGNYCRLLATANNAVRRITLRDILCRNLEELIVLGAGSGTKPVIEVQNVRGVGTVLITSYIGYTLVNLGNFGSESGNATEIQNVGAAAIIIEGKVPKNRSFSRYRATDYSKLVLAAGCVNDGVMDWGAQAGTLTGLTHQIARLHNVTVAGAVVVPFTITNVDGRATAETGTKLTFLFTSDATPGRSISFNAGYIVSAATITACTAGTLPVSKYGRIDFECMYIVGNAKWIETAPLTWI